jgi:hypothetical protein
MAIASSADALIAYGRSLAISSWPSLPGWRHSVLTGRQGPDEAAATEAVIAFLRQRLQPAG